MLQRSFVIALALVLAAWAQMPSATMVGRVDDTSGSPIPGVSIRVVNRDTGEARVSETDADGNYSIVNIAPGRWELFAEKPGFRRAHEPDITLQVDQTARLELQLPVGDVAESIEVKADIPLLNTDNATRGEVIVTQEITEMPLEGRDFNDLSFLVPGVSRRAQGGQGGALSINGARGDNTNFLIDGFNNQSARGGGAQARPPIDALQEFKMQTTGYAAEFGRLAGGVMNMVLKAGGNKTHGTLFHFLRNDVFDARNFFDVRKSALRRNQFGGTVNGPIIRNRLFYLGSWESYRQVAGSNRLARVPTELERAGDYSQTIDPLTRRIVALRDPFGNAPFDGNLLPASRVHPASAKIQPWFPLPNRPGQVNNFLANRKDADSWDSFLGKLDYRMSEKDQFSGRFMLRREATQNPFSGSDTGLFGLNIGNNLSLGGFTWTRMWTARTISEVRTGMTRQVSDQQSVQAGTDFNAELGLPSPPDPQAYGFPRITVRDLVALGNSADPPIVWDMLSPEIGATVTMALGTHVVKFGGTGTRNIFIQPTLANMRGTFNFLGRWTNDPYADFQMGLLNNSTRRVNRSDSQLISSNYGFFVQDDWRVHKSLTVNLGLRYELNMPMYERKGRLANFVPELAKIVIASDKAVPNLQQTLADAGLAGRVAYADDQGIPRSLVNTQWTQVAPRIGLAWRPFHDNRTVVRSGYGIFYGGSLQNPVRQDLADLFPFSVSQTFNRVTTNPLAVWMSDPFPGARAVLDGITNSSGMELRPRAQYLQSWNLTIERDLGKDTAIEMAYVGSKGTHLGRRYDVNQPFRDPALRPGGTGAFPRPFTGINAINYYAFNSNSHYHSAIVTWRRRFARGVFFRLNYMLSKSIDDASQLSGNSAGGYPGAQDARNLSLERARSDFDNRHTFLMNYSWDLPLGRGFWRAGWQLSGTGRMYSGQPFTPRVSNVQLDQGEANRPDRIANGRLDVRTPERWFDLSAFPVVPLGTFRFGNSGRNVLDGPGFVGLNFALFKRFNIWEKQTVQFRWEVFNAANRANFLLPNNNVNAVNGGTITEAGAPRSMQFALKWVF